MQDDLNLLLSKEDQQKKNWRYGLVFVLMGLFLGVGYCKFFSKTEATPIKKEVVPAQSERPLFLDTQSKQNISLSIDHANIQWILQQIAHLLDLNLIVSPAVRGTISLHLTHVTAEDIFDTVLMANDLIKKPIGKAWFIEPRLLFLKKQQEVLKTETLDEEADVIETQIWPIRYAKAEDIVQLIQDRQHSLLSKRGQVRADVRTNSICIQDTHTQLQAIHRLIGQLDIPVQQVLIEARLASIDTDFEQELGVRFEAHEQHEKERFLPDNPLPQYSLMVATLADRSLLDIKLAALENEGHGELISTPSLFTANQQSASIEAGEEIPYQQVSRSGGTGIAFKKAVLSLKVTPHIMPDKTVLLTLSVNQDKPSHRIILGVPAISTRQISTNVLVKNQQTIVLGGIYETNQEEAFERIPFLSKIPGVGLLFQQKNKNERKRELLIFVTPNIVEWDHEKNQG